MLDMLKSLIAGTGMAMAPSEYDQNDVAVHIAFSRSQLLRASFRKLYQLGEIAHHLPLHRSKAIMMFLLIIANHFETIPNDVNHPIAFRKSNFLEAGSHLLREFYNFLSPPSFAAAAAGLD